MKYLSLFSGIGAPEQALKNIGINYELVGFSEIDKYAIKSYCAVHGVDESLNLGDITKIDIQHLPNDVDLITHGSPCFLKGEQVNTITGFKNIEDIKKGDLVKSHDGTYNKVIETMINKNDEIYDLKCSAIHNISSTGNHPFLIMRNGKKKWINAKDITKNDYMMIPINKKRNKPNWNGCELNYNKHTEISNKLPLENPEFWYIVGRFIGDGWVTKRNDRNGNISGIKICCGKHEKQEMIDKFGDILHYCIIEDRTTYKFQFSNKELGIFCSQFGIGAINKHIPQNILDLDKKYLEPLLQGIVDSDGHFSNKTYKVSSISKKLVYNIGELVLKIYNLPYRIAKTIRPKKHVIEGRIVNQHDTYTVSWSLSYLERINHVDNDYLYSRVRKINSRKELLEVYNLEVENTHTYCVNNIAVHNCQDYSVAGKGKGGDEGSNTRSSLMWNTVEIVRQKKPKYVLWENVKNVLSKKHKHNFDKYISDMESIGYNNYYKVLNAKDYGIPQNRERIFVISIRKDIDDNTFEFPKPQELKLKLKDILEDEVDERYYLSDDKFKTMIQKSIESGYANKNIKYAPELYNKSICIGNTNPSGREMGGNVYSSNGLSPTITLNKGEGIKILTGDFRYDEGLRIRKNNIIPTLTCKNGSKGLSGNSYILETPCIAASRGRNTQNPSDRTPGIELEQRLEINTKGTSNTITSVQKDNYVIVREATKKGYAIAKEGDSINLEQPNSKTRRGRVGHEVAQTLTTSCNQATLQGIRIRKLTPRECWKLMGFKDEQFNKAEKVCSSTQLYKQAGNSIVVNVLEEIFKNLFNHV